MSTQLINLIGSRRIGSLNVVSFYGGNYRKKCLQLTIGNEYIQLERNAVIELFKKLSDWLEETN